jgi:hypothetical protein
LAGMRLCRWHVLYYSTDGVLFFILKEGYKAYVLLMMLIDGYVEAHLMPHSPYSCTTPRCPPITVPLVT